MEPRTLWERNDEVASGSRVGVKAAAFEVGAIVRGGVTLTTRVPSEFGQMHQQDGSVIGTLLLDPTEARGLAQLLQEAADEAEKVGPGLYSD
jgi:hypothetical protein